MRNFRRRIAQTSLEEKTPIMHDSRATQHSVRSKKPYDLAIAGELNLDLILYGLPLEMDTERDLVGTGFTATLGSSSAIFAHNAATLGMRVQFATLIGDDDFGRMAIERLRQAGIETAGVILDPLLQTGVTILLPHGPVRHSLSYLGSISALTVDHLDWGKLSEARHFHLSSLYLQTGLHQGIVDLLRYLKNAGLSISLDTNDDPKNLWGDPLYNVLPYVDIFLPSENEICRMAGGVGIDQAALRYADRVPTIIIKRGRLGCRVVQGDKMVDHPGLEVTPVDTIGAGDSFDAGFLCAYLNGMDLATCARAGNIAGALSTLSPGGTESFRNSSSRRSFLQEHGFPGLGE